MKEKLKKNIGGVLSIALLVIVLSYVAGIIAQLMININAWEAAGSNYNVSPGLPSLNVLDSWGALFNFPEGPIAIGVVLIGVALICV